MDYAPWVDEKSIEKIASLTMLLLTLVIETKGRFMKSLAMLVPKIIFC
jgi:hypothetical protein